MWFPSSTFSAAEDCFCNQVSSNGEGNIPLAPLGIIPYISHGYTFCGWGLLSSYSFFTALGYDESFVSTSKFCPSSLYVQSIVYQLVWSHSGWRRTTFILGALRSLLRCQIAICSNELCHGEQLQFRFCCTCSNELTSNWKGLPPVLEQKWIKRNFTCLCLGIWQLWVSSAPFLFNVWLYEQRSISLLICKALSIHTDRPQQLWSVSEGWMAHYLQDHQSGRQITANSPSNHPVPPLSRRDFLFYLSLDYGTSSNPPASRTCEGWVNSSPGSWGRAEYLPCLTHCVTFIARSSRSTQSCREGWQSKPVPFRVTSSRPGLRQSQELPVTGAW